MNNRKQGFTLIELMVVVAMIGILASVSLPQYQKYIHRSEVVEALGMAATFRENVTAYYVTNLEFPVDNVELGVPPPELLIGNRITSVTIDDGAIHVVMGNKAAKPLQGKALSFLPAVVDGSPTSPIAWLCGYDEAVQKMTAVGENKTNIEKEFLPSACR